MTKLKVLELFAGIGAVSKALEDIGVDFEIVDAVEIDKYALNGFNAIHGTCFETQDIREWNKNIDVDLISHGSPCQDFSAAGRQAGGNIGSGTRSSLMYETIRIVGKIRPKYVIWENVKNLLSKKHKHNFEAYLKTMESLGYTNYYQILNASDYGIPQHRERVFTVSVLNGDEFEFPKPRELKLRLRDMLDEHVEQKYYLSEKMINYIVANNIKWTGNNGKSLVNKSIASTINTGEGQRRCDASNYICKELPDDFDLKIIREFGIYGNKQGGSVYNINGISPTLTTKSSLNWNVLITDFIHIRRLTPRECFKLMGFSVTDYDKIKAINTSDTQCYKMAGNSICVPVLRAIFENLFKNLN